MIGTIRKHSKWLWLVIITVVIITFVSWQSPSSRYDRQYGYGNLGSIDGRPITKTEYVEAQREVYLRYFLTHGDWPDRNPKNSGFDAMNETYYWLFMTRKLNEFDVRVDSSSVAKAANDVLSGLGRGQAVPLDRFVQLLQPQGLGATDLERFLRHDLARQQMVLVLGLGGKLITPEQAQSLYERNYQDIVTEAVFYSASNYLANVPAVSPEALSQFYTNAMSYYRVPDLVQVSYVAFDVTNLLVQAEAQFTNLNELVQANLRQLGTNYLRYGKTPEEVRVQIREKLIHDQAVVGARQKADAFANELFDMNPVQASNLAALAKTRGLTVKVTGLFDEATGPAEFDGGVNFARAAFLLTADRPFVEQPIVGADAIYMIALDKKVPSEVPPLDRIRDRVMADYRNSQATGLARRAGDAFFQTATNALAQGKAFDTVCADANIKPVKVPPFSIAGVQALPLVEEHVDLNYFKDVAFRTLPGRLAGFAPPRDLNAPGNLAAYVVVYVQKRLPIDPEVLKAKMPDFLTMLRRARQQEALSEWFNREASKSLVDTPLNKGNQAPPAGRNRS
jgi:hypothetical protein